MDAADREVVALVWHGRANGERATAETFRIVADGLAALGAEPELTAMARRAVDDELRHAELCWRLAEYYAARTLPAPRVVALDLPTYDGASDELRHTLHVTAQCCLNETTASAFLERCLRDATDKAARALLRELLSDEVEHARLGWAHLASPRLSTETRQAVASWLPRMAATNARMWGRRPAIAITAAHAAFGVPAWETVDEVVAAAFEELIVPGFRHVGIAITS
jgi:rubrerythrin